MKMMPFARPVAAALIFASAFAASSSEAFWPRSPTDPVKKEDIQKRAAVEFTKLIKDVEANKKIAPDAKVIALDHIRATQADFEKRAIELKKPQYEFWEFEYVGERVLKVIIPGLEKTVAAVAMMPMQAQAAALKVIPAETVQTDAVVRQDFIKKNFDNISDSIVRMRQRAVSVTEDAKTGDCSGGCPRPMVRLSSIR